MSQADLNRVRSDLETMRHAAGLGVPYGRRDVHLSLAWAAAGLPLALWTARSAVDPQTFALLLGIPAGVVLVLTAMVSNQYRRGQSEMPALWREHRLQWVLAGVLVVLMSAFKIWGLKAGLSVETMVATVLFMTGVGLGVVVLIDRTRRHYAGWAASTMLFGFVGPVVGQRYVGVAVGAWLFLSGIISAMIMGWQLHKNGIHRAPH